MASTAVPTGSSVTESAVIEAPLSVVWRFFKLQNFATFWTKLSASEYPEGAAAGTDIFVWTFKDGTVLEVKQEEYSEINHFITYSVISAKPQISYTSSMSTIRLFPITSGKNEGHTFVQWSGIFSSDAGAGVIEDAKYKRREALADLAAAIEKQK